MNTLGEEIEVNLLRATKEWVKYLQYCYHDLSAVRL